MVERKVTHSHKKRQVLHSTHAWVIWLLSALFMFYKYAIEVSPSIMTSTLMSNFHIDGVALGNLAASYFYSYLLLQIPAGILLDHIGPRKVTTLAIGLCAMGCMIFAKAETIFVASIGRFLSGAGAAFAAVNCLKLTANWFSSRQFAFMAGLMMTVAMLGAVGGQAPLDAFIHAMDWRYAMEFLGIAGLILAAVFWIIIRDLSPAKKAEKHLLPQRLSVMASLKQILKNPQAWWVSIYSGFAFAPVMIFGGLWGVSFIGEAFYLDSHLCAKMVSLIFIGFAVGAPFFGWLSDWLKRRVIVMFFGTLIALVSISMSIYLPGISVGMLGFLLFLFGFSISSFLLCFTIIREINAPILAATAVGFMNAFDALFGAFSDPLTGKLLDLYWVGTVVDGAHVFSISAYKIAFLTLPAYLLIALFTLTRVKETRCKELDPTPLP